MYVQSLFAEERPEALDQFIADYPLGAFIVHHESGIEVDHLPCTGHVDVGDLRIIRAHVARGNPLWKALQNRSDVLIVFQSPNAYISPGWMPNRKRHGKVAPSWNYAAVHVNGTARVIEDGEWLKEHLTALSHAQEQHRIEPWSLDETPQGYIESLLPFIVGIEITVTRRVGKRFVGQQRSPSDREGVVAGLKQEGTDAANAIAEMMMRYAASESRPK